MQNQIAGDQPVTDDPEVLPADVTAMTEENEGLATPAITTAENKTSTIIPTTSTLVSSDNAADFAMASVV